MRAFYKSKAIVEVCSADMRFRSSVKACSPSSLIRLRRGGSSGLGWLVHCLWRQRCVCVCVSRVVDCSSLVMHRKFPLCWEI